MTQVSSHYPMPGDKAADSLPIIVKQDWRRPATFEIENEKLNRKLRWWFGYKNRDSNGKVKHEKTKSILTTHSWPSANFTVRNVNEIKRWFRRLRPQEAVELAKVDATIDQLHEQLSAARALRQTVLREAWSRGHVVTWKELFEQAETNELENAAANAAKGL